VDISKQFVTGISRKEFWQNDRHWPREGPIYGVPALFITRAFDLIGRHLFPGEWLGVEGWFEPIMTLPAKQSDADEYTLRLVEKVLADRHPEFRGIMPIPRTAGGLGGLGGVAVDQVPTHFRHTYQPFHDEDWSIATRIFEDAAKDTQPAIDRRVAVAEWLATHINDKRKLRVIVVDRRTANAEWGNPAHWNCHPYELEGRWIRGSYYIDNPFVPVVDGPRPLGREVRIFLVEEDLRTLLNGQTASIEENEAASARPKAVRDLSGDAEAAMRIKSARFEIDKWRKAHPNVTSALAIAKGASPATAFGVEVLRKMLAGTHKLSNRLQEAGMLTAWK
jgi:hypothetical protein